MINIGQNELAGTPSNINKARSTYHSSFIKGADQKSDDYMNNYLAAIYK